MSFKSYSQEKNHKLFGRYISFLYLSGMKEFDENIYIPYVEAKQLNGLGYDLYFEFYKDSNEALYDMRTPDDAPCILWQNAFKWFREEHNLTSHIHWTVGGKWDYTIEKSIPRDLLDMSPIRYRVDIETYEEAELACLRKLIEIVKKK